VSCTTDGAPAMIGEHKGVVGLVRKKLRDESRPNVGKVVFYHCIIHQESLVSKVINNENVMHVVIKCVNFIRSRALIHRQFRQLLDDVGAEDHDVIYHCDIRWLSRGAVLKRFWSLREEINEFMKSKNKVVPELENSEWLIDLAFLVDITSELNHLNVLLQGSDKLASEMYSHVKAFSTKTKMWNTQLKKGNLAHFKTCRDFCSNKSIKFNGKIYAEKLHELTVEFERRFTDFELQKPSFEMFQNPFSINPETVDENLQMELIDLQENLELKAKFTELSIKGFYRFLPESISQIRLNAARTLCMFGSTYICEVLFSAMLANKSKVRSQLSDSNLRAILKVHCAQAIQPNIEEIVKNKRCRVSSQK